MTRVQQKEEFGCTVVPSKSRSRGSWGWPASPLSCRRLPARGNAISEQLLYINVQRFRGGLVFKAHRRLYHSTLGLRVINKWKLQPEVEGLTRQESLQYVTVSPPTCLVRSNRGRDTGRDTRRAVGSWSHFVGIYRQKLTRSLKN